MKRAVTAREARIVFLALATCLLAACGKKGPPLPPLVKLPIAPAEFDATRRGTTVDISFTVPASNTDNSKPANVSHVDVYALGNETPGPKGQLPNGPSDPLQKNPEDQLLKQSRRVASVNVKSPRDPNETIDEDEPAADMEPPEGAGLDQGARAHVSDDLDRETASPATGKTKARKAASPTGKGDAQNRDMAESPLLPGPMAIPSRTYVAVGVSSRGRHGPLSKRIAVPLLAPPAAPASPIVQYDEHQITVKWQPLPGDSESGPGSADLLPAKPFGPIALWKPELGYDVYDSVSSTKLNKDPLTATELSDQRITWGERRCYTVRAVEIFGSLNVESDAAPPVCVTLVDTFPPAPPANVQSSPGEGAITLIWDANSEADLGGYLVLRGGPGATLAAITPAPIQETTFRDVVPAGVTYEYAVQAVDKAGNISQPSNHVQETAR